jgi:hypothetical protein
MTEAEQAKLQRQAQEFWQAAKMHLIQSVQPGNPRAFAHGIDRSKLNHRSPYSNPNQGFSLQSGRMPSDTDVSNFINKMMGGNPYEKALKNGGAATSTPAAAVPAKRGYGGGFGTPGSGSSGGAGKSPAPQAEPNQLFERMMMAAQGKMDEANAANEYRYAEGKGELTGIRTRNQDRATNWGIAAQADVAEQMKNALLDTQASLASKGLGGSTIYDSFALSEAQKTAREQQRISEMRDSRASDYDTRDTGNLVGFIERREDTGPDYMQLMQMAQQHGLAQQQALEREKAAEAMKEALAQQQARGTGGQTVNPRALVQSGPRGGATPMFMGANPVQLAMGMGLMPNMLGGARNVVSNRYPTPRGGGKKKSKGKKVNAGSLPMHIAPTIAPPLMAAKFAYPAIKKALPKARRAAANALDSVINYGVQQVHDGSYNTTKPPEQYAAAERLWGGLRNLRGLIQ